ncbi:MAG TPA: TIGR04283 family arsenosugar biosynthesis glycosyltransferase [Opitutus sp.]|nr:TIGR04283 family arsenosugar biosynthesis glycosyltransferase [Opitutus sp.]
MKSSVPKPPLLLVFLKAPRPGFAKTRLAAALGPERALDVYRALVVRQLREIPAGWPVEIHFTPADAEAEMRAWLGPMPSYVAQTDGDLGRRLRHAFAGAFDRGASRVIVIGGDCPELDDDTFHETALRLARADVVLGPAVDGGYYLLALRRAAPSLFSNIPWGTSHVLGTTFARAGRLGLARELLVPKSDVDDLTGYRRYLARVVHRASSDRLAIIIPTFNETASLAATLAAVARTLPNARLIVADGQSHDGTRDIAVRLGAQVVVSARGRGTQCRAGAAAAPDADWLLFLHADTLLPPNAGSVVANFIARLHPQVATFRLRFDGAGRFLRACAWFTRFDSVFTRFGDQGILIRRELHDALGGFPDWPLFEDVALLQRAREFTPIASLPAEVATSPRRFERRGAIAQQWLNARLLIRYLRGGSPFALAAEYRDPPADAPETAPAISRAPESAP